MLKRCCWLYCFYHKNACCGLTLASDKHAIFGWSCSTAGETARLGLGKTASKQQAWLYW
jgi:hypothetical protein